MSTARLPRIVCVQSPISVGGQLEAHSRLNFYLNQIFNLHDASGIFQLRALYDWEQDLLLTLGVNLPYGPRGSEFGGIPSLLGGARGYNAGATQLYVRLSYYF